MKPWKAYKQAQRSIKVEKCSVCGSVERVQRHHPDIDKPLEVIVLCQTCHKDLHVSTRTWGWMKRWEANARALTVYPI